MINLDDVISHPRFVGLWTYRPYGVKKQFCASVMVEGVVSETEMCGTWQEAVGQAGAILDDSE